MGALNYKTRRNRRNRLAAELFNLWGRQFNPSLLINIQYGGLRDLVGGAALTYSRASAAWAFDSSGILRQYESGVPRIVPSPIGLMAVLLEPQSTNKCIGWNANPVDLTQIGQSGDAARSVSVVDDSAAIAAAGLSTVCSSGKALKVDTSGCSGPVYIQLGGPTGNLNKHSNSAYVRGTVAGAMRDGWTAGTSFGVSSSYARRSYLNYTPNSTGDTMWMQINAGGVAYIILQQLEELPVVTSPIVVAGSQVTRVRDELTVPASFAAGGAYSEWMDFVLQSQATTASALIGDDASVRNLGITSGLALQASNGSVGLATGNTYTLNARGRAAMAADSSGRAIVLNGSAVASDANTQMAIAQRRLGFITAGSDSQKGVLYLHGYRLFNTRLSNAALQALTS